VLAATRDSPKKAPCLAGVELIELRSHVVERVQLARHRQKFDAGLVQAVRSGERGTARDAEELDVTPAVDIDGEHADRADRQALGTPDTASRSAHVTNADALTLHQNGSARRVGASNRCFQGFRSSCENGSAASRCSSRRKQSVPATDIGWLVITFARWLARPFGITM